MNEETSSCSDTGGKTTPLSKTSTPDGCTQRRSGMVDKTATVAMGETRRKHRARLQSRPGQEAVQSGSRLVGARNGTLQARAWHKNLQASDYDGSLLTGRQGWD